MSALAPGDLLEAAHHTGRQLVEQAIFAGDRCNWIGAAVREGPAGTVLIDHRSLDATVYEGTSGIGLFLAELAQATGDAQVGTTAAAALRQALDRIEEEPPSLGLYTGTLGVVVVVGRAAVLLEDEGLTKRSAVQRQVLAGAPVPDGFDLLSGAAGAVTGLLALAADHDDPAFIDQARRCGEALLQTSRRTAAGRSWGNERIPSEADLTGLSHGATGPALALAGLSRVTGDTAFAGAARDALRYESSLFDASAGNWPDLRNARRGPRADGDRARSFATFWCHGAPGMAAARLELLDLLDPGMVEETALALATTARAVRHMLDAQETYCVCHGLAGNAEVLLQASRSKAGARLLGQGAAGLPEEVAAVGCARYPAKGQPWPSGVHGGHNPSLFLGSAGVGRFLLRLHDARLPTLLLGLGPSA
jgi:lantibiotic modifying enzyme